MKRRFRAIATAATAAICLAGAGSSAVLAAPVPAPARPAVIPAGVTIAGVEVGHLTPAAATQAVQAAFARHLTFVVDGWWATLTPSHLATPSIDGAVRKAKVAAPGTDVPLVVSVHGDAVRAAVAKIAQRVDRTPKQAAVELRNLRPYVAPNAYGRKLDQKQAFLQVVHQLATGQRTALRLATSEVEPRLLANGAAPVIVIDRAKNQLTLYKGTKLWRQFHVATGQASYPTPSGDFHIIVKWVNPTWYPPTQDAWAAGLSPVPPGPDNPLGTRWMGINAPGVGIHGTDEPSSIGYSLSHGCIRMQVPDSEWLFDHVDIGTPVFIR